MFKIIYQESAQQDLARLRAFDRAKIVNTVDEQLCRDPKKMGGDKKIIYRDDGTFIYQFRVGDYRIFYDVDEDVRVTIIQNVKHKGRKTTGEIL